MSNDWAKIKIVRDINKLNKGNLDKSKIPEKYSNFLKLVKSQLFTNYFQKNINLNTFALIKQPQKIKISDLQKIDIDFIKEIVKLNNIRIVDMPKFEIYYIENNELKSRSACVSETKIDTLKYIKNNQNYLFYIYLIDRNFARWYRCEDKNFLKRNRKEKLEKIQTI